MARVNICKFPYGKSTCVYMLLRYFAMPLMARLFTRHGLLQNNAHWCTAIDISVCRIPEDGLTYQPLLCNSILTYFIGSIFLMQ